MFFVGTQHATSRRMLLTLLLVAAANPASLQTTADAFRKAVPVYGEPQHRELEIKLRRLVQRAPLTLYAAGRDGDVYVNQLDGCAGIAARAFDSEGPPEKIVFCHGRAVAAVWTIDSDHRWALVGRYVPAAPCQRSGGKSGCQQGPLP